MVSLRLSEEEYQFLLKASLSNGARSISDYARDALFRVPPGSSVPVVDKLKSRMDKFETELQSLHHHLQGLAGSAPRNTP